MSAFELTGASRCRCNCSSFEANDLQQIEAFGISGVICLLLFLIPALVLELYFVCKFKKTNFLLRSFFYLSIAAAILNGAYVANYLTMFKSTNSTPSTLDQSCDSYIVTTGVAHSAALIEICIVLGINLALMHNLHKYILSEYGILRRGLFAHCTCVQIKHPKSCEVIFVIIIFAVPMAIILCAEVWMESYRKKFLKALFAIFYFLLLIDTGMSISSIAILISWFRKLKRKNLLTSNVAKLVLRELSLFIWLLIFELLWSISAPFEFTKLIKATKFSLHAHLPLVQAITPIAFFMYMYMTVRQPKKKVTLRLPDKHVTFHLRTQRLKTTPPSTRVSLPTDTAAHAPNLLSPSTAGPTVVPAPLSLTENDESNSWVKPQLRCMTKM